MSAYSTGLGDDEKRLVVGPKGAAEMLDLGVTKIYELLKTGELESYLDGSARKISVSSIRAYHHRRLDDAKANPNAHQTRPLASSRKRREAQTPAAG